MYRKTNRRMIKSRPLHRYHAEPLEPRVLLAANVVINELMYHAASQNPADEWLELYNAGDASADLGGWNFGKGISYTFAPGTTLAAGGYLVVAHDLARFQSQHPGVTNVVGPWQGSLGNNGDNLELDDSTGASQDQLSYGSEGDWAVRRQGPLDHNHTGWVWTSTADGGGKSMELMDPALGNDSGQNWAPSIPDGGTPGAPNSVASSDIAPEILDLQNLPLIPKSTDPVTITARIVDEQVSGQTVAVHWRVDGTTTWNTAPMADDGAHNDGAAGDGVWGAILPPQPNNTVVELYVSASDATGHTRTWPGPTDAAGTQGANVLYQVDDTTYTGNQPMFKLIMTDAQRAELAQIGSNSFDGLSNAQMNGTFVSIDGTGTDVRYTIGIRNRGGGSRHLPPNNYRININNDHRWHGLRALDVNGQYSMEDIAGSAVVRAAGLSAQQAVPVQVRVNNANLASVGQYDMFGTYSWVEAENSDLVADEFPTDSNGNYYRGVDPAHNANLSYLGTDPSLYYTLYPKQTNSEVNDYSDLINLIRALIPDTTQNPEPQYLAALQQNLDVTEWMRYFAVNALLGNEETALGTGYGDDFSLYRGLIDTHFKLLPHDLDTILGRGDSPSLVNPNETIFKATTLPVVNRFLKDQTLAPIFYQQLLLLTQTTFSAASIGPILDNALKGYVPQAVIDSMKTFAAQRVAGVLAQIPQALTAVSPLALTDGYPYTTATTTSLSGQADVIKTRSVLVNGVPAIWTAWQGTWSAPSLALHPGINRVLVQSLDGSGNEVTHTYIDVWRDTGTSTGVSGTLPVGVTEWTLANAPYHVTGTVTVPAGATLIIDPGVTVFFEPNTGLTVNGLLNAQGTALQKIVLARTPAATGAWDRLLVQNTEDDGKIAYAVMENAGSASENVQVIDARLDIDHLEWLGTTTHIVDFVNASFRLTNSIIPTVVNVEPAHFLGMPANGYALVQDNVFGTTTGHNDIFDFTGGARPGPIFQVLDNVFLGTGTNGQVADDILDVDGTDAHIEHNLFMNVVHSPINDTNSAISGGNYNYGSGNVSSNVVSVRNIYYNCDQAIMMKEGNFFSSINDTIVNCPTAAFVFDEPNFAAYPGRGGYIDGDILYNVAHIFANVNDSGTITQITVNHTIDPGVVLAGIGNLSSDPELVNVTNVTDPWSDFQLRGTSPARGSGPNGRDMGAAVPTGASISGEPPAQTNATSATLTVGGPDIYAYEYRVNNGPWSAEIDTINPGTPNAVIPPIQLTGMAPGTYTVYVTEKNDAGAWQDMTQPTVSKTWTVNPSHSQLLINEVLALNGTGVNHEGTFPDVVELYNDSASPRDLSGMSLSDKATNPQLFVFPQGTTIDAHGYLVLYANKPDGTSGIHLGFALNGGGEDLKLYDPAGNVVDQVSFGQQITDLSIGRMPDGSWTLTDPTFGGPNVAHLMGDPSKLKINEWLTNGLPPFGDFVELYNTDPLPVPLGGLYLTDHPITWSDRDQIHPLSFIPAHGFMSFRATGDNTPAPDEVNFKLSHDEGMIGLFDSGKHLIDQVIYGSQTAGVSQGRSPDGGPQYAFFPEPSPGVSNPAPLPNQTVNYTLTSYTDDWHYYQSGAAPAGWQAAGTNFADSWSHGGGLLYVETSPLPAPKTTPLTLGQTTYYFRRHFNLPVDPSQLASFQLSTIVDDGAIVYINGVEVFRIGMPTGAVSYSTFANRVVDNAVIEGPFNLPTSELVRGDNVIAVEVHQGSATSSDIVWGGMLSATANVSPDTTIPPLRITEINYNPAPPPAGNLTNEDFEFIELQNTGQQAISLAGDSFTAGVSFVFPNVTLDPGQYVLVVKNQSAFESRYGTGFNIAGQYGGNLDNIGEEIRLQTASGESILDFAYAGSWYPTTDGAGHTLVIRDPLADPSTWNRPTSWRPSTAPGGSPGAADPAPPQVVGRWVFYNHSMFDGNTAGVDSRDDAAIASDKAPLLAGHSASFENYTSYSRGINGIMIDVNHLPGNAAISAADFVFKIGNNANFAGWLDAPAPTSITVRHNAGGNGIDRIEIIWPDYAIKNTWLQVTLKADDTTLLATPDVFCFGNAIGESGNSPTDALVTSADELAARNDPHSFLNPASITNAHDYNRDGRVDAIDQLIARNNGTTAATALTLLSVAGTLSAAVPAAAPNSTQLLKPRHVARLPVSHAVALPTVKKPARK